MKNKGRVPNLELQLVNVHLEEHQINLLFHLLLFYLLNHIRYTKFTFNSYHKQSTLKGSFTKAKVSNLGQHYDCTKIYHLEFWDVMIITSG